MDLLGGLSFLGHIGQNNKNSNQPDNYTIRDKEYSGDNIMNNNNYKKVQKKLREKARKKKISSQNFAATGVVPPYYNSNRSAQYTKKLRQKYKSQDSDFSEGFSDMSESENADSDQIFAGKSCDSTNQACLINECNKLKNNKYFESQYSNNGKSNQFLEQFESLTFNNPGNPVSLNNSNQFIGDDGTKRLEAERQMAINGGFSSFNPQEDMTFGMVDKEHFVHDNMQPNFRSSDGGFNPMNERSNADFKQRKMELFTGSTNSVAYRPKTERKPLFDPVIGMTNMYGTPVLTNFMDSRYIPSNERRNEKPFQETKVTPGLNLGYNENAKFGFHDVFRVLPKTVDQLRVANKPKITYSAPVIAGMKGQKGAVPSKMYKRRPLTFKENKPIDWIRGKSYITAPTIHGEFDPKNMATVNRGVKELMYQGPAKFNTELAKPDSMFAKNKVSLKENFKHADPRNIALAEGGKGQAVGDSWIPDPTQRSVFNKYDRAGNVGNPQIDKEKLFDYLNGIPDPTMRNIHDKTDRAGNLGNAQFDKNTQFDYINGIPDPTMRNIHDKTDRAGNVGNAQFDKTKLFDFINSITDPNMRNIHDRTDRAGNVGNAHFDKPQLFDFINSIPDPNMRNIHDRPDRAGNVGNANYDKPQLFDFINNIPDATMRDIHDKTGRAGNIGNPQFFKQYIFDYINSIPDATMRDIHDKTGRAGNIGNPQIFKQYLFDYINSIPDPTMRDIHSKMDRAGGIGNPQIFKQFVFDYINAIPDPTMRDIHNKYDRAGGIGNPQIFKQFLFDYINAIPDPTLRDIHNKYGRAGQVGNAQLEKHQLFDFINNIPDITMRDIHNKPGRAGQMGPREYEKQRGRGDANNMRVNTIKEVIAQGREPTNCNYAKGPMIDFTMVNLKEPININRDIIPDIQQNTTDRFGTLYTKSKQNLPQQSFRFYSFVEDNLNNNPYINNVIHQSNNGNDFE